MTWLDWRQLSELIVARRADWMARGGLIWWLALRRALPGRRSQGGPLIRDLYDLAALSTSIDAPQAARMWILKSHTATTSGSRRRRGGPAASIDELTADKASPGSFSLT